MPTSVIEFVDGITNAVINPILALLFAGALFYFVLGLMKMIFSNDNAGQVAEGKNHMVWGLVGMAIMVSVKTLLWLALNTFGVDAPTDVPL